MLTFLFFNGSLAVRAQDNSHLHPWWTYVYQMWPFCVKTSSTSRTFFPHACLHSEGIQWMHCFLLLNVKVRFTCTRRSLCGCLTSLLGPLGPWTCSNRHARETGCRQSQWRFARSNYHHLGICPADLLRSQNSESMACCSHTARYSPPKAY